MILSAAHARYLRLLGLNDRPAGLDGLRDLVDLHIRRVPFENVSKLLLIGREGRGRLTTLEEFLDGLEYHDLGGTCYTSNLFLAELLDALGYDAGLLGADMSAPNVHTSIRIRLGGTEYHVDAGFAAPFREPIRLDRLPHTIEWGRSRYVFEPSTGGHAMTQFIDGQARHGYFVHPPPRPAAFFDSTILASFEPGKTFMRCLRITRFFDDFAVELRNRRLVHLTANSRSETTLESLAELRRAVNEEFQMPRCRIEEAVAVLERLNEREFFGDEPWRDSTD